MVNLIFMLMMKGLNKEQEKILEVYVPSLSLFL